MKIHFTQIYASPGVSFPFTHNFQKLLSKEVTSAVSPSPKFISDYGSDWNLDFNISAKKEIQKNEIRGPAVYKNDKEVEFTIFLPFDLIPQGESFIEPAILFMLNGVYNVLNRYDIDTSLLKGKEASLVQGICSNPAMIESEQETEIDADYTDDINGDVFRRMETSGFNFEKEHVVDFHAVMETEEDADKIAQMYLADDIDGEKIIGVETKPFDEGGMEINLEVRMIVSYERVTKFEAVLAERVSQFEGYLDGWGVLQDSCGAEQLGRRGTLTPGSHTTHSYGSRKWRFPRL